MISSLFSSRITIYVIISLKIRNAIPNFQGKMIIPVKMAFAGVFGDFFVNMNIALDEYS